MNNITDKEGIDLLTKKYAELKSEIHKIIGR